MDLRNSIINTFLKLEDRLFNLIIDLLIIDLSIIDLLIIDSFIIASFIIASL